MVAKNRTASCIYEAQTGTAVALAATHTPLDQRFSLPSELLVQPLLRLPGVSVQRPRARHHLLAHAADPLLKTSSQSHQANQNKQLLYTTCMDRIKKNRSVKKPEIINSIIEWNERPWKPPPSQGGRGHGRRRTGRMTAAASRTAPPPRRTTTRPAGAAAAARTPRRGASRP